MQFRWTDMSSMNRNCRRRTFTRWECLIYTVDGNLNSRKRRRCIFVGTTCIRRRVAGDTSRRRRGGEVRRRSTRGMKRRRIFIGFEFSNRIVLQTFHYSFSFFSFVDSEKRSRRSAKFLPFLQLVVRRRPFGISMDFRNGGDFFWLDPRLVPPAEKVERFFIGLGAALVEAAARENVENLSDEK